MNYSTVIEDFEAKIRKRNQAFRSKSVYNLIPYLLGNVMNNKNPSDYMTDWIEVSDTLCNLDDNNIIKIFLSFTQGNFDRNLVISEKGNMTENLVSLMIYSYYYAAFSRPHIIDYINRIFNYNMMEAKILSYYGDYNDFDEIREDNIYVHILEVKSEIFNYICDMFLVNNCCLFTKYDIDEGESIDINEQEFDKDIEEDAKSFINWAYILWDKTRYFYGMDYDTVERNFEMLMEELSISFNYSIEFFASQLELAWYYENTFKGYVGTTKDAEYIMDLTKAVRKLRKEKGEII